MSDSTAAAYYEEARRAFRGYKRMAEGAFAQIRNDEEFFYAPDSESLSLALIVKHLAGNLRSRWTDFLTTDGEKPDRNRDQEFILRMEDTRADLMRRWEESFTTVFASIGALQPEHICQTVTIRGDAHTVLQAINRSLAHTAYHVGQITYLAKHIRREEWNTLSVPKGKSAEFNAMSAEERRAKFSSRP